MTPELAALLVVQEDDARIRAFELQREAITPRLAAVDAALRQASAEVQRTEQALDRETTRLRQCEQRLTEIRQHLDRQEEVLGQAQRLKEATAAAAQVETARRMMAEADAELLAATRRVADLRTAQGVVQEALVQATERQAAARTQFGAELERIDAHIATERLQREQSTQPVGRPLLSLYDRIYTRRRTQVVFSLHPDYSCGACDTAIPLQRRPAFSTGRLIEPCEACGVLLYRQIDAPV